MKKVSQEVVADDSRIKVILRCECGGTVEAYGSTIKENPTQLVGKCTNCNERYFELDLSREKATYMGE